MSLIYNNTQILFGSCISLESISISLVTFSYILPVVYNTHSCPPCDARKRRPSRAPLRRLALAEAPLFKWAKLSRGGERASCLVWLHELQRDFNDVRTGLNTTAFKKLNENYLDCATLHISQIIYIYAIFSPEFTKPRDVCRLRI